MKQILLILLICLASSAYAERVYVYEEDRPTIYDVRKVGDKTYQVTDMWQPERKSIIRTNDDRPLFKDRDMTHRYRYDNDCNQED